MSENSLLRVVHLTTVPETLKFFTGQIEYLCSHGCQISAVSSPGPMLDEFGRQHNIEVQGIEMHRRITPLHDLGVVRKMVRYFRRVKPHIVHANTPKAGLLGMLAARIARTPVRIYHMHGLPLVTAQGMRRRLLHLAEKTACRLAHRVLTVSDSLQVQAYMHGVCPLEKMRTFANGSVNGIDAASRFNPRLLPSGAGQAVRDAYNIPADALVLGYVGRIVRDKGVAELVGAWRRLRDKFPRLHLLAVGYFEPHDPLPADIEQTLRTDPRIHLTGQQWETPPYYAAMDILAMPSYREGFGIVPLEAAAMEKPVVASRVPGCADGVVDGKTGSLAFPRDVDSLQAALEQYIENPMLRIGHGIAGRERVLRDFQPQEIWRQTRREYFRLARQAGLPFQLDEEPQTPAESFRRAA